MQSLLRAGASVDARSSEGLTPLLCAAQRGHADVLGALLQAGAAFNACSTQGTSAVSMTVLANSVDCIRRLIAAGADLELRPAEGMPPLLLAVKLGLPHLLQLLVSGGGDPYAISIRPPCSLTYRSTAALLLAIEEGDVGMVRTLLRFLSPRASDGCLMPLAVAVQHEQLEVARLLLDLGADIDEQDFACETALMFKQGIATARPMHYCTCY